MTNAQRKGLWSLSDEQQSAIEAGLKRHMLTQQKRHHLCPDRRCRRWRTCSGPDLPCLAAAEPLLLSRKQEKRAMRALRRNPPRV